MFGGFEEMRLGLPGDRIACRCCGSSPGAACRCIAMSARSSPSSCRAATPIQTGNYGVGDFAVGPGPEQHEPIADPGEPCIALIVVEKPIVLTGPFGRFLNPLVRRGVI